MSPHFPDPSDSDSSSDFAALDSQVSRYSKIASQLRDTLEASGIVAHKQRGHVARVLNVSKTTSRRLLLGETSWTDDEISAVLNSVGLDWVGLSLVDSHQDPLTSAPAADTDLIKHRSTINIEGMVIDCEVFESALPLHVPVAADALCISGTDATGVIIQRSSHAKNWSQLRMIKSIHLHPKYEQTGPRVAILDDSPSIVSGYSKMLSLSGFRTEGFTQPMDLIERCQQDPPFDAYLLDWSLQDQDTISHYIPTIRQASPRAAIVLASGNFDSAEIDANATLIAQQYNLNLLAKPSAATAIIQTLLMSIRYARSASASDESQA